MRPILIIIGSVITITDVLPYIKDILKKETKPRAVSWFTWALLAGISAAASLSDHQWAAGVLSLSACIECLLVVILGLKYGDKRFTIFDISCQIAALIGLLLWFIFNSPALAVIAGIIIDLIASLPTLRHAWQKPSEETWITFMLSSLGAAFAVSAATSVRITAIANPIYIIFVNLLVATLILWRRKTDKVL